MTHKALRIEIAGICAEILVGSAKQFRCLELKFENFLSVNKPAVRIVVEESVQPLPVNKKDFTRYSFLPNRITIAERDGEYLLLVKNGRAIHILGLINVKKKLCRLFTNNTDFSEALFVDAVRGCLHIFLQSLKGILLHASGAIYKGRGYLFTGPGGSGKSTAVNQLNGTTVLSDECIGVKKYMNSYYMFGTPFHGNNNQTAALKGIFFPKKAKKMSFKKVKKTEALQRILSNMFLGVLEQNVMKNIIETLTELVEEVPCYEISFSLSSPILKGLGGLGDVY
ncbi:MAG: hypothetical protein ABH868_02325 [bacterium]